MLRIPQQRGRQLVAGRDVELEQIGFRDVLEEQKESDHVQFSVFSPRLRCISGRASSSEFHDLRRLVQQCLESTPRRTLDVKRGVLVVHAVKFRSPNARHQERITFAREEQREKLGAKLAVGDIRVSLVFESLSSFVHKSEEFTRGRPVQFAGQRLYCRSNRPRPCVSDLLSSERGALLQSDKQVTHLVLMFHMINDEDVDLSVLDELLQIAPQFCKRASRPRRGTARMLAGSRRRRSVDSSSANLSSMNEARARMRCCPSTISNRVDSPASPLEVIWCRKIGGIG